jgi:hypothetical protein
MFAPKWSKASVEWRRLHNEELDAFYSSPNIIQLIKSRRIRWTRQVARIWERRGVYMTLVRKPEKERPIGRPGRRWEYNIKMELQDVVWEYGLD